MTLDLWSSLASSLFNLVVEKRNCKGLDPIFYQGYYSGRDACWLFATLEWNKGISVELNFKAWVMYVSIIHCNQGILICILLAIKDIHKQLLSGKLEAQILDTKLSTILYSLWIPDVQKSFWLIFISWN